MKYAKIGLFDGGIVVFGGCLVAFMRPLWFVVAILRLLVQTFRGTSLPVQKYGTDILPFICICG